MSEYAKFLPPEDMPAFHAPFWDSVAAHQAAIQKCTDCGTFRFIPREICPNCHSMDVEWTPISGDGEIYSYTVVHRAPTPAYQADAPYVIIHVKLEEGPRMIANLTGVAPEEIRIGLPVKITYTDVTDGKTLFGFAPAT